jgi:hypothetical protein
MRVHLRYFVAKAWYADATRTKLPGRSIAQIGNGSSCVCVAFSNSRIFSWQDLPIYHGIVSGSIDLHQYDKYIEEAMFYGWGMAAWRHSEIRLDYGGIGSRSDIAPVSQHIAT